MRIFSPDLGRRAFIGATAAIAGGGFLPSARAAAKYRRYDVSSPEGRRMLVSYAKAIRAMLKLPPQHPHNWFRNAFVHFLDCPHGNWWFYIWHRGYIGYFEQIIRKLSNDPDFALPYWDWSKLPRIPPGMFDSVLTPTDRDYLPYTRDIGTFTRFIQPAMRAYWGTLTKEQLADQTQRGVMSFNDLWAGVTGAGVPGNAAFAATPKARYLSRQNPGFDAATAYDCSTGIVLSGLAPTSFYASDAPPQYLQALSFNSVRTTSHTVQPGGATWFSVLEGMPHNNAHNYIGGVGPWDPGPYGNMTNFLSPVDPIFFLHHANMDRLWDIWTRKQQAMGLPFQPNASDAPDYMKEPFRYFVDSSGSYLTDAKAADYFSTTVFDYDYAPGTGEEIIPAPGATTAVASASAERMSVEASVQGNRATLTLPKMAAQARLVAAVTIQPTGADGRAFDVLVNAPAGEKNIGPDSPYFAGRVAFFGPSTHRHDGGATFLVPLPHTQSGSRPRALATVAATGGPVNLTVVPAHGTGAAPAVKALSLQAL